MGIPDALVLGPLIRASVAFLQTLSDSPITVLLRYLREMSQITAKAVSESNPTCRRLGSPTGLLTRFYEPVEPGAGWQDNYHFQMHMWMGDGLNPWPMTVRA